MIGLETGISQRTYKRGLDEVNLIRISVFQALTGDVGSIPSPFPEPARAFVDKIIAGKGFANVKMGLRVTPPCGWGRQDATLRPILPVSVRCPNLRPNFSPSKLTSSMQ